MAGGLFRLWAGGGQVLKRGLKVSRNFCVTEVHVSNFPYPAPHLAEIQKASRPEDFSPFLFVASEFDNPVCRTQFDYMGRCQDEPPASIIYEASGCGPNWSVVCTDSSKRY